MFRKGKALGELGYFEKSVKILEEVKAKNPDGTLSNQLYLTFVTHANRYADAAIVDAEVARLKVIDDAKDRANKQKLKGTHLIRLI